MRNSEISDKKVKGICKGSRYEDGVIFCNENEGINPPNYEFPFDLCDEGCICIATRFIQQQGYNVPENDIKRMHECKERGTVNKSYEKFFND